MPSDIRNRLEKFVQEEDKKSLNRLKKSRKAAAKLSKNLSLSSMRLKR